MHDPHAAMHIGIAAAYTCHSSNFTPM